MVSSPTEKRCTEEREESRGGLVGQQRNQGTRLTNADAGKTCNQSERNDGVSWLRGRPVQLVLSFGRRAQELLFGRTQANSACRADRSCFSSSLCSRQRHGRVDFFIKTALLLITPRGTMDHGGTGNLCRFQIMRCRASFAPTPQSSP